MALVVGAAWSCGFQLVGSSGVTHRHNKALHPTARSVVVFPALSLGSKLVVTGGRRVSLAFCCLRAASSKARGFIDEMNLVARLRPLCQNRFVCEGKRKLSLLHYHSVARKAASQRPICGCRSTASWGNRPL